MNYREKIGWRKKKELSLRDLWDYNKGSNICTVRFLEGKEKEDSTEKVLDFLINKSNLTIPSMKQII